MSGNHLYQRERKHRLLIGAPIGLVTGNEPTAGMVQPTGFPFQIQFDPMAIDDELPDWITPAGSPTFDVAKAIGHEDLRVPDYPGACGQDNCLWYIDSNASSWGLWIPLPVGITFGSGFYKWEMFTECDSNYTQTGVRVCNYGPGDSPDEAFAIQWVNGGDYPQTAMYHNGTPAYATGFGPGISYPYGDILAPVVQQGSVNLVSGYMKAQLFGRLDTNNGRQDSGLVTKTMALTMDAVPATWVYLYGSRSTASENEWGLINFWMAIDATAYPAGDKV